MVKSVEKMEFFRVYLPKYCSTRLRIPPEACIRYFKQSIPKKAILKDYTGRLWDVSVEECEDGLAITKGWEDFAIQHSLELGDFLVFTYDGGSHFDVVIFGINGCKKDMKMKGMNVEEDLEVEVKPARPMHSGGGAGPSQHGARRKDVRNSGHRLSDGFIIPLNPYFVKIMTCSSRHNLSISAIPVKFHGINLMPELVLHDQNGNTLTAILEKRLDGRMVLVTGWVAFYKTNKLMDNDKCLFEFIIEEGKCCRDIHVQVVRAKPEP